MIQLNHKKINNAIQRLIALQLDYAKTPDTMFISQAINQCINTVGNTYAELSEQELNQSNP